MHIHADEQTVTLTSAEFLNALRNAFDGGQHYDERWGDYKHTEQEDKFFQWECTHDMHSLVKELTE
jgi:hypothetical protein